MPAEIIALIDKPWLLLIVLAVGAGCGIAVERFVENLKKAQRRAYWRGRKDKRTLFQSVDRPKKAKSEEQSDFAAEQLKVVMRAKFRKRPLLNKSERRLLSVVDAILAEEWSGMRAMGQVNLGEILWSEDREAYFAINAKRVDLLIVDEDCQPLLAVEFQGSGHHMSDCTAARDAAKREALRRAGIGYAEVAGGDRPSDVREIIRKLALREKVQPAT